MAKSQTSHRRGHTVRTDNVHAFRRQERRIEEGCGACGDGTRGRGGSVAVVITVITQVGGMEAISQRGSLFTNATALEGVLGLEVEQGGRVGFSGKIIYWCTT